MASFAFKGKIIAALPEKSGISKKTGNPWKQQSFVIEETEGQFPKKLCFDVLGEETLQKLNIAYGEVITAYLDFDAREFTRQDGTSTWFNSIKCFKVEREGQQTQQQAPAQSQAPVQQTQQQAPQQGDLFAGGGDNLPF